MFCQLCGRPLPGGSSSTNICPECTSALGANHSSPISPAPTRQINVELPDFLKSDERWPVETPSAINAETERAQAVRKFLNQTSSSSRPTITSNTVATNSAPPNSAARPTPDVVRSEPVEVCAVCGRSFPRSQIFQVRKRDFVLRNAEQVPTCANCLNSHRAEWQSLQTHSNISLILAILAGLAVNIFLSLLWAWGAANSFNVAVFAIMLVGLVTGRLIKAIFGGRKDLLVGKVTAGVTGGGLLLAFYFLYSEYMGSIATNWSGFTTSIQKNHVPFLTIVYFLLAFALAVVPNLSLEPVVRNSRNERVAFLSD